MTTTSIAAPEPEWAKVLARLVTAERQAVDAVTGHWIQRACGTPCCKRCAGYRVRMPLRVWRAAQQRLAAQQTRRAGEVR